MVKKPSPEKVVRKTVAVAMLNIIIRRVVDNIGALNTVDPIVKSQTIFNEVKEAVSS